jgi:hypothetical protein
MANFDFIYILKNASFYLVYIRYTEELFCQKCFMLKCLNKYLFILIVSAACFSVCSAQNDTISKEYFPNKNISYLTIKTAIGERSIIYYESGIINSEGYFYESGKLKITGSYIINRSNSEKSFKKDTNPKDGKWIYYNESGKIDFEVWYKNGHTKKLIQYDEVGKIIWKYKNHWWDKWDNDSQSPYKRDF